MTRPQQVCEATAAKTKKSSKKSRSKKR